LGQFFVDKNAEGIQAFITNHGFLDNPTFRGMRWSLMNSFDKIYIIDLHGNAKKKETAPDGSKDENVFDIQQGVSINIFVKTGQKKKSAMAEVYHSDLYGLRPAKFNYLQQTKFKEIPFAKIQPSAPEYFFVPKDYRGKKKYDSGFSVAELFPVNSVGIVTARDEFTIHESPKAVSDLIADFLKISDEDAREKYDLDKDVNDWSVARARADLLSSKHNIVPISYRPFDVRYTSYSGVPNGFHCRPRRDVMKHFIIGSNIGLVVSRQAITDNWSHVQVTKEIIDNRIHYSNKGIPVACPLYLYHDNIDSSRIPNLNIDIVNKIDKIIKLEFEDEKSGKKNKFAPIDILDYIYAFLYSSKYREKYKEFLKIDFPRVPYPADATEFCRLVKLGCELRQLHLMEHPDLKKVIREYPFSVSGDNAIDKLRWEVLDEARGRVWINATQYFDKVPLIAWNFYIGGYQPAQKWLKDRKGRILALEDIEHYQRIVKALVMAYKLMERIDNDV
jgi:predicted helicase